MPTMGDSGLLQLLQGIMDMESIRVIGAHERGAIGASTLTYKFVLGPGTAAVDWLDNGDLTSIEAAWTAVVRHFHKMPIEWVRRGCCRAQRTARPGTNMRF